MLLHATVKTDDGTPVLVTVACPRWGEVSASVPHLPCEQLYAIGEALHSIGYHIRGPLTHVDDRTWDVLVEISPAGFVSHMRAFAARQHAS